MANMNKKREKLVARIKTLETTLALSLQKKAAGPAIDVSKATREIQDLKLQLTQLTA